jgi:hypothetical protein
VDVARKGALALAIVLAAAGSPCQAAAAADVSTQLDYDVPPGCPSVEAFESIVNGQLGYDPFRAGAPNRVTVRIEATGRALEGRLEWLNRNGGPLGERTFPSRSGDCGELTRAMGFALALQIQLMAITAPKTAAAPAVVTTVPEPPPRPPTTVASPTARIESTNARSASEPLAGPWVLVGGGISAGVGLASAPIAVGRLFATAEWSHFAVELGGEIGTPSTTNRADGAGFTQEELLATLAACGVRAPWSACGVAKIGELRVEGQGVDVPLTASGLMAQAGVRLAAWHSFGRRTYMVARGEGLVRLTEGVVTLDSMAVWTSPRFAAVLGIDIGVRFR